MTCCVGKARIYYREPINYLLTYQLPNGDFGTVTAPEPLSVSVIEVTGQAPQQVFWVRGVSEPRNLEQHTTDIRYWYSGPAPISITNVSDASGGSPYIISGTDANGPWSVNTPSWSDYMLKPICSLVAQNPEESPPPTWTFKVIGTETGTVYREIGGLEESPTVISNICLMGEEKYIDVSMGNILKPFDPIISPLMPDCILSVDLFDSVQIFKRKVAVPRPIDMPILNLRKLPGCDPTYRVVCLPDGDPKMEKCPPDTDCELDCGDFICCYKDGRVIKTIYK